MSRFTSDFAVKVERGTAGETVIEVRGELDSGTCDAMLEAVEKELGEPRAAELTLDLRNVTFIDSAGTRAVILTERKASERGTALTVVPPPEEVTELLRTAGVADRINMSLRDRETARRSEFTEQVELELPRDPLSPSRARSEVRELISGAIGQPQLGNLVLLTSELVTNAVVHPRSAGQTPIGLRITRYRDGVRVEVDDAGEGFDPAMTPRGEGGGGRGLFLVDRCAASWGARRAQTDRGPRFQVWFELEWPEREALALAGE